MVFNVEEHHGPEEVTEAHDPVLDSAKRIAEECERDVGNRVKNIKKDELINAGTPAKEDREAYELKVGAEKKAEEIEQEIRYKTWFFEVELPVRQKVQQKTDDELKSRIQRIDGEVKDRQQADKAAFNRAQQNKNSGQPPDFNAQQSAASAASLSQPRGPVGPDIDRN